MDQPDPTLGLRSPGRRLALTGAAAAPVVALTAWQIAPAGLPLALAILAVGLALSVQSMTAHYDHDRLGACNVVTVLRLALAASLAAAIVGGQAPDWTLMSLALLAFALDGVDGALARRAGLSSDFGARFDMEVDAALAAILALLLMASDRAGPELLVLGFIRYAFLAASIPLPWLAAPLEPSLRRKTVCAVQIGTLAVLLAPALPEPAARPMALLAAGLLIWSFGRDIRRLARRR